MKKSSFLFCVLITVLHAFSQPYVDPFNVRFTHAFHGNGKNATPFNHVYIGSDMPLRLKTNQLIVLSPYFENWNIDSSDDNNYLPGISSAAFPVIFQLPLGNNKWKLQLGAIPRFNSEGLQLNGDDFQMGGIVVANYQKKENLTYRFGIYANNEFFGLFIIPLAGIDWKISDRDYLFGLLPGRLTYEHKLSDKFYAGGNFRFITNSYRMDNGDYLRIDDNQLSAYLDCYATKQIVFTGEAGYGILRKLRRGSGHNKNYIYDYDWGDGLFVKLNASYRIRL